MKKGDFLTLIERMKNSLDTRYAKPEDIPELPPSGKLRTITSIDNDFNNGISHITINPVNSEDVEPGIDDPFIVNFNVLATNLEFTKMKFGANGEEYPIKLAGASYLNISTNFLKPYSSYKVYKHEKYGDTYWHIESLGYGEFGGLINGAFSGQEVVYDNDNETFYIKTNYEIGSTNKNTEFLYMFTFNSANYDPIVDDAGYNVEIALKPKELRFKDSLVIDGQDLANYDKGDLNFWLNDSNYNTPRLKQGHTYILHHPEGEGSIRILQDIAPEDVNRRQLLDAVLASYFSETVVDTDYHSDNYPNNYPDNANQTELIDYTGEGATLLILHFEDFVTEEGFDFLSFENPDTNEVYDKKDGSLGSISVTIPAGKARLKFTSDGGGNEKGWKIDHIKVLKPACHCDTSGGSGNDDDIGDVSDTGQTNDDTTVQGGDYETEAN